MIPPAHETRIEDMILPPTVLLPSGKRITVVAALDATRPRGFAHPSYRRAVEFGRMHGASLVSYDTISEMYAAPKRVELIPVTLPNAAMYRAFVEANGLPPSKASTKMLLAWQSRLMAPMASLEWQDIGDGEIWDQIDKIGTLAEMAEGGRFFVNDTKWFQGGAPPGRCYIRGWRVRGRFIQAGVPPQSKSIGPHGDWQFDYGTGVRYEWPADNC